ncbi:hypothetical protein TraAM80_05504 [Trypanosoma rangeli]|uniref:Uncharacterized protein n=1 Tax=Trypanosoma rangeli TaxID=5698 RepID=A0A422NFM1_TRYRA|nr:uncharacterized protein TraAM80_05504 [Trypanosoma rangeli]RNF04237.1 hypothetical protein TraAM80_05504 [Trypanosoma rangeli]|eukprot:RNF04237.1 hypothetical protein TraAM80_05504 [Trypanosoma rangeli]
MSTEHKNIARSGQPQPPPWPTTSPFFRWTSTPNIEWFEYPKYPYTREKSIRMTEESWESTMDEMASRYGMQLNMTTKPTFWMAWSLMVFYSWYTLWGCYRAMGTEPGWPHFRDIVVGQPNVLHARGGWHLLGPVDPSGDA